MLVGNFCYLWTALFPLFPVFMLSFLLTGSIVVSYLTDRNESGVDLLKSWQESK